MIFWENATNTISKQQEGNYLHNTPTLSHYSISPYPPEVSFLIYVRRYWRYYVKILTTAVCSIRTSMQTFLEHSTEVSENYYRIAKYRNPC